MRAKRYLALTATAAVAVSLFTAIQSATAGPTTYPVAIAPNGVGACPGATSGSLSNVTTNATSNVLTIQCASPGGFAWGRQLDTPNGLTDATIVDDGTTVALAWAHSGQNNSGGRALGLGLRVGDMRVNGTTLTYDDETPGFEKSFNGMSRRPDLALRMGRTAWMSNGGSARCKASNESAGVTWTNDSPSLPSQARRNWTASILVDCSAVTGNSVAIARKADTAPRFMSNTSGSQKIWTQSLSCGAGATPYAVGGGFDISQSSLNVYPQVIYSGPSSDGMSWQVTLAVPSQNSAAAQAALKISASCSSSLS